MPESGHEHAAAPDARRHIHARRSPVVPSTSREMSLTTAEPAPRPTSTGRSGLKVAYLINQYPGISHTFIRREILALEAAGTSVARFAVRGWSAQLTDPADEKERTRTRYLLRGGVFPLVWASLRSLLTQPARFLAAFGAMLRLSRGGDRSLPYYVIYLAEAALLAQWLRAAGAQHLHAHFGTNPAAVAQLASHLSGIGYSFTVHGPDEFDKPAAISLERKVDGSKFVVAISSYGRSQIFRWIDRHQWHKVKVVHCGLDQSFHAHLPAPGTEVSPRSDFVCVGRICEQKGQLLLVEALALLSRRGTRCTLVLAGDGPMRSLVEAHARELGVEQQVRITGWIGGEQVRAELLDARVMVLPSFAEGLPVVIMEAMALRRPVISTYVAGIPELVVPGMTGWLVPAGDVEALADTLASSLQVPPGRWSEMGAAARERVLERHSIDTEAAKLCRHFAEVVAQQGS
jgi:colanic acid/amylovoran biosynthesis glycosyltransferase